MLWHNYSQTLAHVLWCTCALRNAGSDFRHNAEPVVCRHSFLCDRKTSPEIAQAPSTHGNQPHHNERPNHMHSLTAISESDHTAQCSECRGTVKLESNGWRDGVHRWRCSHTTVARAGENRRKRARADREDALRLAYRLGLITWNGKRFVIR
jgi:hypothetical protein